MFKILRIVRKVLGKITDILDKGRELGWYDKKKLVLVGLILGGTVLYAADMSKVDLVQKSLDALAERGGKVASVIDENSPKEAMNLNILAYNKYILAQQELQECKELKNADSYCDRAQHDISDANDDLTRALAVINNDKSI